MKLYTWKDVERWFLINRNKWEKHIWNIEVYYSEIVLFIDLNKDKEEIQSILTDLLGHIYDRKNQKIQLELDDRSMDVIWEIEKPTEESHSPEVLPLFRSVLYKQSAYRENMFIELEKTQFEIPVIAFHSYKGGVGRTLSLIAFMKAWSNLKQNSDQQKLLVVDSDIEAPGLTWLSNILEDTFSYLDLLEVIQEKDSVEEVVEVVAEKMGDVELEVETETIKVKHILLPTYRYKEQMLDIYASPESIVNGYNKEFMLAKVLSELGKRLGVAAVLVDLRAGVSEFSAPLLFDPRVKKYIVSSTSEQSVKGTELVLKQIRKGLRFNNNILLPEIILTMIPDGFQSVEIVSRLLSSYETIPNDKSHTIDNLVTELPFASELIHLDSFQHILNVLSGRDFYKKIFQLVENRYTSNGTNKTFIIKEDKWKKDIKKIYQYTSDLIDKKEVSYHIYLLKTIYNLAKKYELSVPQTVIVGSKGTGRTFMFREILNSEYCESFLKKLYSSKSEKNLKKVTLVYPLLSSVELKKTLINPLEDESKITGFGNKNNYIDMDSICSKNKEKLIIYLTKHHSESEWIEFWKGILVRTLNMDVDNLDDLNAKLAEKQNKILFLIDGLEEVLEDNFCSTQDLIEKASDISNKKNAIKALGIDIVKILTKKYKNIGVIIFLRRDVIRNFLEEDFNQFFNSYKSFELKWTIDDAKKFILWIVSKAIKEFYKEEFSISEASNEMIEQYLEMVWGNKLGEATSNASFSTSYVIAALLDFNGHLKPKDIIYFLKYSTSYRTEILPHNDRYIMPEDIKRGILHCSYMKCEEFVEMSDTFKLIFNKLEKVNDKKILPIKGSVIGLNAFEEELMIQEGYLKIEKGMYYIPEILGRNLGYYYQSATKPKLLSLLGIRK